MDSYPPEFLYTVRSALFCLLALVGLGGGFFLIIRKYTLPGILALVGFVMFGGQTLLGFILNAVNYTPALAWVNYCLYTIMDLVGMTAFIAAFLSFVLAKKKDTVETAVTEESTPVL